MPSISRTLYRFGQFELDLDAEECRRNGRRVKLQPQPFKLLVLLIRRAGHLVTRDDIRAELWTEGTFVDFDQAVNFAIKQIRDAMSDSAERPLYIETVPRRGYRFIAPVDKGAPASVAERLSQPSTTTVRLQKALWTNIAELRLAEARRRRLIRGVIIVGGAILVCAAIVAVLVFSR